MTTSAAATDLWGISAGAFASVCCGLAVLVIAAWFAQRQSARGARLREYMRSRRDGREGLAVARKGWSGGDWSWRGWGSGDSGGSGDGGGGGFFGGGGCGGGGGDG